MLHNLITVVMCFVTKATPMRRKLRYISKCNRLVQLVVQVQYHVTVIYSLRGGHTHTHVHTHTNVVDKAFQETGHAPAESWYAPGLNNSYTHAS